jgi:hypothetical protein
MSQISNKHAPALADLTERMRGATNRMYDLSRPTRMAEEELISCRRILSRIIQDMMGDYYREEAAGNKARQGKESHVQE